MLALLMYPLLVSSGVVSRRTGHYLAMQEGSPRSKLQLLTCALMLHGVAGQA
jgi:hypothetical protein